MCIRDRNITERPGGHQSHRRRERTGISDGNKRLSKKISGERKVIKTEKADFKLKEVISRIGPASYMEVYRSMNEDFGILGGHLWRTNLKRHSKNLELKQQNS